MQPNSNPTPWTFGEVQGPDAAPADAGLDGGPFDGGGFFFDSNLGPGGFFMDAGVFIDGPPPDLFVPPGV